MMEQINKPGMDAAKQDLDTKLTAARKRKEDMTELLNQAAKILEEEIKQFKKVQEMDFKQFLYELVEIQRKVSQDMQG